MKRWVGLKAAIQLGIKPVNHHDPVPACPYILLLLAPK
jgi:hypothetical protein